MAPNSFSTDGAAGAYGGGTNDPTDPFADGGGMNSEFGATTGGNPNPTTSTAGQAMAPDTTSQTYGGLGGVAPASDNANPDIDAIKSGVASGNTAGLTPGATPDNANTEIDAIREA